jgi:hypothetical protein
MIIWVFFLHKHDFNQRLLNYVRKVKNIDPNINVDNTKLRQSETCIVSLTERQSRSL